MVKLSKLHLFRAITLLAWLGTGIFVSSCSSDVQEKEATYSSFTADQVTALDVQQESTKTPNWNSIVIGTNFSLKVCLNDVAIENQPARNAHFEIVTPFRRQSAVSDPKGCLSWDDHIEFNYLEQEGYFPYNVTIIGKSAYNGSIEKKLLINPWKKSKGDIVVDTSWIGSVNVAQGDIRQLNYNSTERTKVNNYKVKNLVVKMRERQINSEERVDELIYDLSFNPWITRKGIKNEDIDLKSDNGQVELTLSLYEKKRDEEKYRLIDFAKNEIVYRDNSVITEMVIKIPGYVKLDSDSVFQARIEVKPKKAPLSLGVEKLQVYFNDLFSSNSILPSRVLDFKDDVTKRDMYLVDNNLDSTASNIDIEDGEDNSDESDSSEDIIVEDHFGYMINTVSFSKGQIVSGNYNQGTNKRLQANLKVCLVDPRSPGKSKPITDTRFETSFLIENSKQDSTEIRVRPVNSNGCLETYAVLTYDKYDIEKFINVKMKLKGVDGVYKGITKERMLAINPWAKGSAFGYDIVQNGNPPEIEARPPRVNITDVAYSNEGNQLSSFRINNYLNLSFKKNFQVNFKLQVERFHSFSEETSLEPLTMGKYHLRAYLFNPKKNDVEFNNPKINDYQIFSASEQIVEAKANGDVVTNIQFPFTVTDSYLLGYKNLLILEVTPVDMGMIRPVVVSVPFYGIGRGSNEKTQILENFAMDAETTKIAINLINDDEKILDSHVKESPLEIFKKEFAKGDGEEAISPNAFFHEGEDINKAPLIGGRWLSFLNGSELSQNKRDWYPDLSFEEIRMMTTLPGQIESRVLKKLCRHFYSIPKRERNRVAGVQTVTDTGAQFLDCLENPRKHIESMPMTHIQKVIPTRIRQNGKVVGKQYSQVISQDNGKVYRGDAFFAAYGNRYARSWGERTSWGTFGGVDITPKLPLMLGVKAGYGIEIFAFDGKENSNMQMDYDRSFTQRTKVNLDYNSITLRFKAKVRHCATITSKTGIKRKIHLCQKEDQYKNSLTETWYFIGRTDMRANSVLADGNTPASDYEHQVIRGTYNYNQIWSKYKKEDVYMVIEQLGTADLASSFKDVLRSRPFTTPNESRSDNSFPGLLIPISQ